MAQYEMSIKIQGSQVNKNEKTGFFSKDVNKAIEFAQRRAQAKQEYFNRVAPKYYWVKLQGLKLCTPGNLGNPQYDPDADRCDDCGRRFWQGHNDKVEH